MPIVVGLNPSIDAEWRVVEARFVEKNEVLGERRWPGGKGVNVARWLGFLGVKNRLLLPLGGQTGAELGADLRRERIKATVLRVGYSTRVNVIVTPDRGDQMRFNPVWQRAGAKDWAAMKAGVELALRSASVLVLSGSVPRGVPVSAYAQFARMARAAGIRVAVDCDGPLLEAALNGHPFLIKPNQDELARWFGAPLETEKRVEEAALALSAKSRGWVLVSRGGEGAMLVNANRNGTGRRGDVGVGGGTRIREASPEYCVRAPAPKVMVRNTVGAGDAFLAAAIASMHADEPPEAWLRRGLAAGSAAASCEAGCLPTRATVRRLERELGLEA